MPNSIFNNLKIALSMLTIFIILTGFIYPYLITGIVQVVFNKKANGSLIKLNGNIIGSELIGQSFTDAKFFNSRPSATIPFPYNAKYSIGSNLAPTNPVLSKNVEKIKAKYTEFHKGSLPLNLVTSSASGLDPHISIEAAYFQVPIIAKARNINESVIIKLIENQTENPFSGFTGKPYINVLNLNIELLKLAGSKQL